MRRQLEIRHMLDIVKGIVFGAMLIGGGVSYMMLNKRWVPKTTINACLVVGIIGMFGLLYWLLSSLLGSMRNFSFLKKNGLMDCGEDIDPHRAPDISASKLFFGEKAVYSGISKMLIPYEQIVWVYKEQHKTNGVTDGQGLSLGTKSGFHPTLPLKKADYESNSFLGALTSRLGANTIYGYSMQNLEAYREIVRVNRK